MWLYMNRVNLDSVKKNQIVYIGDELSMNNEEVRTRSLNAPSPIQQFGPCGRIMRNSAMV
ncbi:hypothetical protein Pmani_037716, partial [Petrolisthes manimaculis]